jgi:hypothetical protein
MKHDHRTHLIIPLGSGSFEKIRDSSAVIVGVVNHEYSPVNYTIDLSTNNSTLLRKL